MKSKPPAWQVAFTREALTDPALCPAERAIIQAIATWANPKTLQSDATKDQIAAGSSVCKRQMWQHLRNLKAKGYLTWAHVRIGNRNRNIYTLFSRCGICMVKLGGLTVQFPHESLQKNTPQKRTPFISTWNLVHFPSQNTA